MTVALDISRLIARQSYSTPTGIDRFELNYARWIRDRLGEKALFIETGIGGPAAVGGSRVRSLIDSLNDRWTEGVSAEIQDRQIDAIVAAIDGHRIWHVRAKDRGPAGALRTASFANGAARTMRGLASGWSAAAKASLLVHVSHTGLHKSEAFTWLRGKTRGGIFYVHDLIPLSHPEFVRAGEPERHFERMRTVLRHARLVLCNSQATARALDQLATMQNLAQPRTTILPPGIDDVFLQAGRFPPVVTARPYFVCVGTIEPRKNHALLLNIWRRMIEQRGSNVPRLVLVGRRGWDNAQLFKLLDRPDILANAVIEVPDCGDRALCRLLLGASALLSPSFVEGYGMPVVEALALRVPVIASNIRSHREIAGADATLLDPLDGRSWTEAIRACAERPRRIRRDPRATLWTWSDHFRTFERFLSSDDRAMPILEGATWDGQIRTGPLLVPE